jgi:hypothetical protein
MTGSNVLSSGLPRSAVNHVVLVAERGRPEGWIIEHSDPAIFFARPRTSRAQGFVSKVLELPRHSTQRTP